MDLKLKINEQEIVVQEGSTIMEAANKVNIFIPHFCYHSKLSIAANCRMCMVDIEKSPKALPACATPAVDGMVIRTNSERAKKAQQSVMEFLLINHPLDCPICDQGGECPLQDLAVGYGLSKSRYQEEKRVVMEKNLGPLIATEMTRCIHCTRCVRFGREIAGIMELGVTGRGEHAEIMPFIESTVDSEISGNMIDICPVGALTSKPFRFSARTWELSRFPVIAAHDSWGSHLIAQVKEKEVKRVTPCLAPEMVEHWISDRDRFSYLGLTAKDRTVTPMRRARDEKMLKSTTWTDAFDLVTSSLKSTIDKHGADKVAVFVSPRTTCEEAFLLKKITQHLGCDNVDSRLLQRDFSGPELTGLDMEKMTFKSLKSVLLIGADPARELPLLAVKLRNKGRKCKLMSISAMDLKGSFSLSTQILTRPEKIYQVLMRLLAVAGQPVLSDTQSDLFSSTAISEDEKKELQQILEFLKKGGEQSVIWLGDIARTAPQYGAIKEMALQLAKLYNCRCGTLVDGANGWGVKQQGLTPATQEVNTASLLRSNLKAVILFRCEPEDFCETTLIKKQLQDADFVCTMISHSGGLESGNISVLFPTADFAETEGSYVNGFGQKEFFQTAVSPPGETRPGWKILRLLGEHLGVDGFDFNDLTKVRHWMEEHSEPQEEVDKKAIYNEVTHNGFSLYGGSLAYRSDMLVRRSESLQKTKQGKETQKIIMCSTDLSALSVETGDTVWVSGENGDYFERVVGEDNRLLSGVVRLCAEVEGCHVVIKKEK